MRNNHKIGLALGSGGLRGIAHIGVIKVLQKNNIPIDIISGASAGSLVGAYLATHGEIDSLEKYILENEKQLHSVFFDFSFKGGFIKGVKLKKFLDKTYKTAKIENTKIPFIPVATDLISGEGIAFDKDSLTTKVLGSMSVPLLFKPVKCKNYLLVDGGLSNPVPIDVLRKRGVKKVIAVNLYHSNEFINKKFTMSRIAGRVTRITLHKLADDCMKDADVSIVIDTSEVINNIKMKDYFKEETVKNLISMGERAAKKMLPKIKKMLDEQ